jgi:hypothetical protein
MTDALLTRFFWRILDRLDYWIRRARLWVVDAACGPFPDSDTPTDPEHLPIREVLAEVVGVPAEDIRVRGGLGCRRRGHRRSLRSAMFSNADPAVSPSPGSGAVVEDR